MVAGKLSRAYDLSMDDTDQVPAEEQAEGTGRAGRMLDAAGIAAGVVLVVILLDIWTDGKVISRWLTRRKPPEDEVPVEH